MSPTGRDNPIKEKEMQVRELIELLKKEPQTSTVVTQDSDGKRLWIESVLDFDTRSDELILEIE